jgi:hypothetical protein
MLVFGNAVPVKTKSPDLKQTLKSERILYLESRCND